MRCVTAHNSEWMKYVLRLSSKRGHWFSAQTNQRFRIRSEEGKKWFFSDETCSWSMMFHGEVMATHSSKVVSLKLDSLRANRRRWEWDISPSRIQWPSRVWSAKKKTPHRIGFHSDWHLSRTSIWEFDTNWQSKGQACKTDVLFCASYFELTLIWSSESPISKSGWCGDTF